MIIISSNQQYNVREKEKNALKESRYLNTIVEYKTNLCKYRLFGSNHNTQQTKVYIQKFIFTNKYYSLHFIKQNRFN